MGRYITTTSLKVYRGIAATETADDALLVTLIGAAEAQIDRHTGRTFKAVSTAAAHYFDALRDTSDDRKSLYLDDDLITITAIVNAGTAVATTHYVTEPRNAAPYRTIRLTYLADDMWTWQTSPEDAITVTGRWGYSTAAPADIQQAATRLAAYMYAQKDASSFDVTLLADLGAMTIPGGMPRDVREMLEPYVRIR
jgi:hypothetical protein